MDVGPLDNVLCEDLGNVLQIAGLADSLNTRFLLLVTKGEDQDQILTEESDHLNFILLKIYNHSYKSYTSDTP